MPLTVNQCETVRVNLLDPDLGGKRWRVHAPMQASRSVRGVRRRKTWAGSPQVTTVSGVNAPERPSGHSTPPTSRAKSELVS